MQVFAVHATKPDAIGAVDVIFGTEAEARTFARSRSRDFHVLAVSVTRFTIGQLGMRTAVGWYVDGEEQDRRRNRPGNHYPTDGVVGERER